MPRDAKVQRVQGICEHKLTRESAPMVARPKVTRLKHTGTQDATVIPHALARIPDFQGARVILSLVEWVCGAERVHTL